VGAVTIFALRSQHIAALNSFPVQRLRVKLLLTGMARTAFDRLQIDSVREFLALKIRVAGDAGEGTVY
jgi:hypothetical protein